MATGKFGMVAALLIYVWSGTRGLTEGGECTGGGRSTAERRQPEVSDGGHGGEDDGVAPGEGCSMATESPTEAGKWENGSAVGGELQVDREFNEAFGKKGLHFVYLKVRSLLPKINEIRLLVCKSETADFSAMGKSDSSELKIQSVKVSHSATYYCACWDSTSWYFYLHILLCTSITPVLIVKLLEFGSGTTLYVTDGIQRKPKVTLYSASNSESNEKTTLLCLARDMFPDLVKISWKIEEANGGRTEVPKAEGEQLEQREEEQTTSMIIIDKENTYRNKYICSVEHEWGAQHFVIPKDTPTTMSAPAFRNDTQESQTLQFTEDSFQSTCSLNLASVVYTVMIVKSMVYCCGLSLLLHNRILGRGPST
ncbi:M1-specific T cell receptor beta chain-like [Oncorhynchus clarkii lewisi]|uniref:M1-specific T cell receptor beta chain-like n=1 Tax=Oncorhynchus clarkii lewisi TaxID=490388 RepID=UPI0039B91EF3